MVGGFATDLRCSCASKHGHKAFFFFFERSLLAIDFYLGGVPHLINLDVIHNPTKAKEERNRLFTEAVGRIHVRLDVLLRHVKEHNVAL
jgi:hypothetical protein